MQNALLTLKMPAYLLDFRCLGPACEDDCCYGWDILVDKAAFDRFKTVAANRLGRRLADAIQPKADSLSHADYAKMTTNDGRCRFFTRDRRCRIHAELGPAFLPEVCAVFPRQLRARRNGIEITASLACPRAARLALENPQAMVWADSPLRPTEAAALRGVSPPASPEAETAGLKMRGLALALLTEPGVSLARRMLRLGFLFETAGGSDEGPVPQASRIDAFAEQVSGPMLERLVARVPTLTNLQLQLVKRLTDEKIASIRVEAFLNCLRQCFEGVGFTGTFTEAIGRRYDAAFDDHFRPFEATHGHMLTNYLVNYLLQHDICFQPSRRLYPEYVLMALHYAMVKTYLIGLGAFHGQGLSPALVTRLVYSFTKAVEPDAAFKAYALDLLARSNCMDMLRMGVLINN